MAIKFICFIFILTAISCTEKKPEKPIMKVSEYNLQSKILKGVPNKVLAETNIEAMNKGALNMLRGRVVDCKPVGEECILYSKVLNTIVQATKDGDLSGDEVLQIKGLHNKLQIELAKNQRVLLKQWKRYREQMAQQSASDKE